MSRRSSRPLLLLVALAALPALAQSVTPTPDFSPPPMVPAQPPPMPPPEPSTPTPGTPPPPSVTPQPGYVPGQQGQTGYNYSPYGQPKQQEKPGPEVGLMVSESLFGALTAAGVTVLPYFLLFANGTFGSDQTLSSIIFVLIFSAAPLAVAQTQVSLANGSRHYFSETWPAALTGLAGQAAVLAIFAASAGGSFWLPTGQASGGVPNGGSVVWLMIGSIGLVPLLQMAAINLFKQPKFKPVAFNFRRGEGLSFGVPAPTPIVAQTSAGLSVGLQLPIVNAAF